MKVRMFPEVGLLACTIPVGGDEYLEVDEQGLLTTPEGVDLKGFTLIVAVKDGARTFVVQKQVGIEGGGYESHALEGLKEFADGYTATIMRDPIDVMRAGKNVWTGWHKNVASNRVDCWHLGEDGELGLFQVGIFTHDNGKSWKLHGEYRWRGQLHVRHGQELVGVPAHPKWGSLNGGTSNRCQIFQHSEFRALLKDAKLPAWKGSESELDSPLPEVPEGKFAVVDWFVAFAGQTGQGIVKNREGKPAWVHGCDVEGFDPNSLEPQLWRGDIISFEEAIFNWGSKKDGPPKLTGVKLVKRGW